MVITGMRIPKVMTRDRFHGIMRFLHFGNNEEIFDDRLGKVRFLLNHLNDTMRLVYIPVDRLSLDESMMLWHGRLIFRQYIKNKKNKYGIKFYKLCQFDGIVLRICIHSGVPFDDVNDYGQTGAVVVHLSEYFLDKGYTLWGQLLQLYTSFKIYDNKIHLHMWYTKQQKKRDSRGSEESKTK